MQAFETQTKARTAEVAGAASHGMRALPIFAATGQNAVLLLSIMRVNN